MVGFSVGMILVSGVLMFKGLKGAGDDQPHSPKSPKSSGPDNSDVLKELAQLRAIVDRIIQA